MQPPSDDDPDYRDRYNFEQVSFCNLYNFNVAKGHNFIELNCNLTSALNDVCKWFKWLVLCYNVERD